MSINESLIIHHERARTAGREGTALAEMYMLRADELSLGEEGLNAPSTRPLCGRLQGSPRGRLLQRRARMVPHMPRGQAPASACGVSAGRRLPFTPIIEGDPVTQLRKLPCRYCNTTIFTAGRAALEELVRPPPDLEVPRAQDMPHRLHGNAAGPIQYEQVKCHSK